MVAGRAGLIFAKSVIEAAGSVQQARELVEGGSLTETLGAIGDVHLTSAQEHLRQSELSPSTPSRLEFAAADMQVAYIAFDKAVRRGIPWVRMRLDPTFQRSHELALGCSAAVALLQWMASESPLNIRIWVDRAARHVGELFKIERSLATKTVIEFRIHWSTGLIESYLQFESSVLPAELVRPRPPAFVSPAPAEQMRLYERTKTGPEWKRLLALRAFYADEHQLPRTEAK